MGGESEGSGKGWQVREGAVARNSSRDLARERSSADTRPCAHAGSAVTCTTIGSSLPFCRSSVVRRASDVDAVAPVSDPDRSGRRSSMLRCAARPRRTLHFRRNPIKRATQLSATRNDLVAGFDPRRGRPPEVDRSKIRIKGRSPRTRGRRERREREEEGERERERNNERGRKRERDGEKERGDGERD